MLAISSKKADYNIKNSEIDKKIILIIMMINILLLRNLEVDIRKFSCKQINQETVILLI